MTLIKKKLNFSPIQKSVLSLFKRASDGYYNYSHYIGDEDRRRGYLFKLVMSEMKLEDHAEYEFDKKLPEKLKKFFDEEIAQYFIPTGNELVDNGRRYNQRYINKECKKKRWKKKLSERIYQELNEVPTSDTLSNERDFPFEIITAFIYDEYNIKNREKITNEANECATKTSVCFAPLT